jgi:hypothetical protein
MGRFGIMLPPTSTSNYNSLILKIGDDKLLAWVYRWALDSQQALVMYAIGKEDLESKAPFYLESLRDKYAQGAIRNQKKTSFAGHPGLVWVVDSSTGSAMMWAYLVKNRFYVISLTLDEKSRIQDHVNVMSTFRLVSPKDIESRLTTMEEELTPEPLAQASALSRPTTDAQDAALKGGVKTVITESEPYVDGSLFGAVETVSVESFDEHGNLVKTVDYRESLPQRVRLYGSYKGERAFREIRMTLTWVGSKDKNDSGLADIKSKPTIYTIKYKYDQNGMLLQRRVLRDGGKEMETTSYNLKANTVTSRTDSDYLFIRKILPFGSLKTVSTLDANGNSIEDAYQVVTGTSYEQRFDYSRLFGFTFFENPYQQYKTDKAEYEYRFDHRGNWIQRISFAVTNKQRVPMVVTYRTIIYY